MHSSVIETHFLPNATAAEAEVIQRVMDRVAANARRELGRPEQSESAGLTPRE